MITYIKNLFNRPKREKGLSRIQESMLIHALMSPQDYYIPFLHSPWLSLFNFVDKPLNRLVAEGYLEEVRPVSRWYTLTDKGADALKEMLDNEEGNAHITFRKYQPFDYTELFNLIQANGLVAPDRDYEHAVKVAP